MLGKIIDSLADLKNENLTYFGIRARENSWFDQSGETYFLSLEKYR